MNRGKLTKLMCVTFCLILLFMIPLTGCQNAHQENKQVNGKGKLSGTINLIMEQVPDTDVIKSMLPEFYKKYPGIKINIEALPYDQIKDKITFSLLSRKPTYDLIVVDNPWMYDFASGGNLVPLNNRLVKAGSKYNYKDFSKSLRKVDEVNGKVYGIPFYNYAVGLTYRKDLFKEADLQPPKTLDELQEDAKKLTTKNRSGIAMQPQRGTKIFEEWANWLFAAGGEIQDQKGNIKLDSPEAREALKKYIETYKQSAPNGSLNWGFDEAQRATAGGKASMMMSYNWMLPTLNSSDGPAGNLAGKFGLSEIPGGKSVLGAWYWAIPANSSNKDAAWAFVKWVTSPSQEVKRVIKGGAPVRNSAMSNPEVWKKGYGKAYYETVKSMLEDAKPLANGPGADEMIEAVGTELSAALSGQKSVDDAISAAAKKAKEIMNDD